MDIRDDEELGMYYRRVYQEKGFVAMLKAMGKSCLIYIIVVPFIVLVFGYIGGALGSLFEFDKEATIECIQDGPWINRYAGVERRLVFYTYEDFRMITKDFEIITSGKWKATGVGKIEVTYEYCKGGCGNLKSTTFEMPDCGEVRAGTTVYTRSGY